VAWVSATIRADRDAGRCGVFAELLRTQRTVAGLSQRELAQRSGLSERCVRDLERGATSRPRHHSVRAVAEALGLVGPELASFLAVATGNARVALVATAADPWPDGDLVGRAADLRRLVDLVAGGRHRIITVTGPAGVGKSRLVSELAAILRRRPDGQLVASGAAADGRVPIEVCLVDLTSLREPELVGEVIAEALGCGGASRLRSVDRIAVRLRGRRVLLILDCYERLVSTAPEISALVGRCPGLVVLATSQRPLQVRGEHLVRLGGLAQAEAVELFVRRARAAAGFALTADNGGPVAWICRQLDGLPLAIELAAAKMRLLTPLELARRLDRRLQVLTSTDRDVPPRHRSLRTALESSVDLLGGEAATVFGWLGAFTGGGLLADIEAVAGALGREPAWLHSAMSELVDISLVRMTAEGGASRHALPDTMAELATERLAADPDEAAAVRQAVAVRYLSRLRSWNDEPSSDARSVTGPDAGNLRTGLDWALEHRPSLIDSSTVEALHRYFELTGRLGEGQALFARLGRCGVAMCWTRAGYLARLRGTSHDAVRLGRRALADLSPSDHRGQALVNLLLGSASTEQRRYTLARAHLRAALKHATRANDTGLVGRALNNLGALSMVTGRLDDAERLLAAALEAKRRHGAGSVSRGRTLHNLSETALEAGDFEAAAARARAAIAELRSGGHHRLAAVASSVHAMARWRTGALPEAMAAAELAGELAGEPGEDRRSTALVGMRRSVVLHAAGELPAAAELMRGAVPLGLGMAARDLAEAANVVQAHAALLTSTRPDLAAALLGAADQLHTQADRPISGATSALNQDTTMLCRDALGADAFNHQHRQGVRLDWATLIDMVTRPAATGPVSRLQRAPLAT
jgi:predicted ATPase/transcriptional regulator with XRE-family HTH domain